MKAFRTSGFTFADSAESLRTASASRPKRLLGLFSPSTMPAAFDKLGHGADQVTNVPMLDNMASAAIDTLSSLVRAGSF